MCFTKYEELALKKKSYIILFLIFCVVFLLNFMKPLSTDDYFTAFVWPAGVKINGILPENTARISSLAEMLKSLKQYYLSWGGRLTGQCIMTFFIWQGKAFFNIFNTLVFILLVVEIYWLSHSGKITLNFDSTYIVWIFFSLWMFNISFNDTILWIAGASTYLWLTVIILAFLIPYVRNYYDSKSYQDKSVSLAIFMLLMGILAGCSFEINTCWIIVVMTYWLYLCKKQDNLQKWKITGYIGLCLGYLLLVLAPGNYSRVYLEHKNEITYMTYEVLKSNVMETIAIFTFHIFLWYFLAKFFYKFTRVKSFRNTETINKHMNVIKACIFIAICSGILQVLIPSGAHRTSFVTLVFLTIAVSTAFKVLEKAEVMMFRDQEKKLLKTIGYSFMILSICCSLWGNYVNWCHWNSILSLVQNAHRSHFNTVLEVEPYPVNNKSIINLLSGFHISEMPFRGKTENDEINRSFARYHGIKGIRVSR